MTSVITKTSPLSVADTVTRLTGLITAKGLRLFEVIDQRAEARRVGLDLRETVLVIFGNPTAGTPVMDAAPLAALDLPLKALIWDDNGQTRVSYDSPDAVAARRDIPADLVGNLAGINAITDALVAAASRLSVGGVRRRHGLRLRFRRLLRRFPHRRLLCRRLLRRGIDGHRGDSLATPATDSDEEQRDGDKGTGRGRDEEQAGHEQRNADR
jgi:uncharacterized protein (DUF302 family)